MTGFVSDDPAELPELIDRAGDIDPAACRAHALHNFDVSRMVEGYEKAFLETLQRRSGLTKHIELRRREELSA
jgi:hypothetical protein